MTTKKLKVNGKEFTFQFNNNFQISGVVASDGSLLPDSQDPMVSVLREMERYDDGEKHSKPQPKVKIGDEIIKLGNRYMTAAEKTEVKAYVDSHSSKSSGTSTKQAVLNEQLATIKNLDAVIATMDEKAAAPVIKYRDSIKAQVLESIDPATLTLLKTLGVAL